MIDEIKRYTERFFKSHEKNYRYDMNTNEVLQCMEAARENVFASIVTTFNYGYAKGYRAALAEMKKGGAA